MIIEEQSNSIKPSASIVVVSYNTAEHIGACLDSILALDYQQLEIIVVDNASTDGSVELIRSRFPKVELVELPNNKGFAGGASVGLFMANNEVVAAVNPDVTLDPDWMDAVVDTLLSRRDVGVVGSKILFPDGRTIQHAGGIIDYPLATTEHIGRGETDNGQYDKQREVDFVTGAALAMWRDVGRMFHFFDEDYYPVYYEDVDLCRRTLKEGLRTIYQPKAVARHKESVTMDRQSSLYYSFYHTNRLRYVIKHYSPEQIMLDFLPAEAERVIGDMAPADRGASLSLLDNRLPRPAEAAPTQRKMDTLQKHIDEVMRGWKVKEKPFKSSAPLVGGLVASLRKQLNNLSTRWYVQPILQQQVDYNASVARALRETSLQVAELEAKMGLHSILTSGLISRQNRNSIPEDLALELEGLRARIEELEHETAPDRNPHGVA